MDRGPIIRKERWRDDTLGLPERPEGIELADGESPDAGGDSGEDHTASRGLHLPLLAVGGLVVGLAVAGGGYFAVSSAVRGTATGEPLDLNPKQIPADKATIPVPDESGPDRTADLEIAIRLWHLAALTQEEVNSLRQGIAASGGIEGTQAEEAMRIALSAKQRELTDRKTNLAEHLREIGEYYQAETLSLGSQINRFVDKLRDERKDSSARWLELSRDWWEAMPATKPTAGYFRNKIDESL